MDAAKNTHAMTYSQAVLVRPIDSPTEVQCYATRVAWIPSKFAKVGKVIRLYDETVTWTVAMAGGQMSEKFVLDRRDDYRYQRRVSDV